VNAGETGRPRRWWKLSAMTYVVAVLFAWCVVLSWIGLHRQVTSSDPAGNGMATGFLHGFAEAGVELAAILTGLYLLCRWRPIRFVCVAMLAFSAL
jgi:hypothetical protein